MARNEAKIRFSAETREFNDAISNLNREMTELRAEFRLNETQMRSSGRNVESLERQHEILSSELQNSENRTEALNEMLNSAIRIFGENSAEASRYRTQLINAQNAEERIRQSIEACNNELQEQRNAAQQAETATGRLTDTISRQEEELERVRREYIEACLQYGETSDEARRLANDISEVSSELRNNRTVMNNASNSADEFDQSLDDAGDSADDASEGFTVMGGAVADLASSAIQAAIGKISEFCGWLAELPEQTRELRQDLATLNTSFDDVGHSTETATETWKELYSIFGEDDRAVETANNIAKIADNEKELNTWIDITTGAWGKHQDSLPVEGLAEAAMETAKTGSVTGVLADALNWCVKEGETFGVSLKKNINFTKLSAKELSKLTPKQKAEYEAKQKQYKETEKYNQSLKEAKSAEEKFQFALDKCTTEQERAELITRTLNGLYSESADTYRETQGAQMEAKDATAENMLAQAELATAIEPVTTAFTELKTELMEGIQPAVEKVSGVMVGALEWAREHPVAMKAIGAALAVVASAFTVLTAVVVGYTVAQWAMKAAILSNPVTWIIVGVVAAIAALVAVFTILWTECEGFRNFFIDAWEKIKEAWSYAKPYFEALWEGIKTAFSIAADFLVAKLKLAWEGIKLVWSVGVDYFKLIFNVIKEYANVLKVYLVGAFKTAWSLIKLAWSVVGGYFKAIWNTIRGVFSVVKSVLSGDFKGAWEAIKGIVGTWASYFKNIWSNIKNVFANVKSWFGNTFKAAWSAVKNIWSSVGSFFSNVISKVKTTFSKATTIIATPFKSALDKVKGFFSKLKLKFPSIKLPHFSLTGSFDLKKMKVPKLSVKWYADGAIFAKPTLFNTPYGLKGVGEAGPEAVLPIDKLEGYVQNAVEKTMQRTDMSSLVNAIEDLASRAIELNINGRRFVTATASDADNVNGLRSNFISRGLVLE